MATAASRARTQAARIERQYQAAEPENRLVQWTLEKRWEEALQEVRRLEEEYARFRQAQPTTLTSHEMERIRKAARDLPALWDAATTTSADRQQIIRFLVERVELENEGVSDRVQVTVTWAGGQRTHHELIRPVARYDQTADFDKVMAHVMDLRATGQSFDAIAAQLNKEGVRPPNRAGQFNKHVVRRLVRKRSPYDHSSQKPQGAGLDPNEWFARDLAAKMGIGKTLLHTWLQRGWVRSRRLPGYLGRCVCWADAEELERLVRLARTRRCWWDPPLSSELTTPKPVPSGSHSQGE